MIRLIFLALIAATPASAEKIMSGQEFAELSTGRTLYFEQRGLPYGAEQFFDGGKSLWQTANGRCQRGVWYAAGNLICFLYEDSEGPACWQLTHEDGQLSAQLAQPDGSFGLEIELSRIDTKPLKCPGPNTGV